jgi:phospholipase/carboxylesterase
MAAGDRGPIAYGAPVEQAERAVVLLHGRDQGPEFMEEHVVRRLALPRVAYVAPVAPERSWYPFGFLMSRAENEPALTHSLDAVRAVVSDLGAVGLPRSRIFFVGFSQGACVAAEYVVRREPARWGALILFTGGLLGAPGELAPIKRALAGLRVYLGTSDVDEWVPLARAEESVALLRAAGADVRFEVFPGLAHEICEAEISAARELLTHPERRHTPEVAFLPMASTEQLTDLTSPLLPGLEVAAAALFDR